MSIEEKYIVLVLLFASEIVRQCNLGSEFWLESRPRVKSQFEKWNLEI